MNALEKCSAITVVLFFLYTQCQSSEHSNTIEQDAKQLVNIDNIKIELYDLQTNDTFLRLPFRQRRQPCTCSGYRCGCCAGMSIQAFGFNQKLCSNFTYDPVKFQMAMNVMMNDNSLYQNMFSARDPPPVCVPVPVPLFPVMADICLKFFNIFMPGRNLHMCLDMEARLQRAPVLVLHFDCMRMGQDGVAFVKPEENGGLPGDGPDTHVDVDSTDPDPPDVIDPPQTDYDIYDQIDEIKHKH